MNSIKIVYCVQCGWLPRSTWMAQELLTTFSEEIDELKLVPSTGGIFEIYLNDKLVWSRKERKGFPEITKLKQMVRDEFNPQRSLGHIDR